MNDCGTKKCAICGKIHTEKYALNKKGICANCVKEIKEKYSPKS